jgi:hypothetical protein
LPTKKEAEKIHQKVVQLNDKITFEQRMESQEYYIQQTFIQDFLLLKFGFTFEQLLIILDTHNIPHDLSGRMSEDLALAINELSGISL